MIYVNKYILSDVFQFITILINWKFIYSYSIYIMLDMILLIFIPTSSFWNKVSTFGIGWPGTFDLSVSVPSLGTADCFCFFLQMLKSLSMIVEIQSKMLCRELSVCTLLAFLKKKRKRQGWGGGGFFCTMR